jgi:putative FmdB family regulatory protein
VPTYQYACTECGADLEVVQSFSDDPLTTCPKCQGKLRKVYSVVGIVFKGSGFYRTDNASSSSSSLSSSSSSAKADSSSSGSASSSSDSSKTTSAA